MQCNLQVSCNGTRVSRHLRCFSSLKQFAFRTKLRGLRDALFRLVVDAPADGSIRPSLFLEHGNLRIGKLVLERGRYVHRGKFSLVSNAWLARMFVARVAARQ